MKIYFGQLTGTYLEDSVAEGSPMFTHEGKCYDFCIETDGETIRIKDAMGRMVPFDITDLNNLANAVETMYDISNDVKAYEEIVEKYYKDDHIICV